VSAYLGLDVVCVESQLRALGHGGGLSNRQAYNCISVQVYTRTGR
jgi:hypothetical protein